MFFMKSRSIAYIVAAVILILLVSRESILSAEIITVDTTWQENRIIIGDLIIPDGVTLTISSGVNVRLQNQPVDRTTPGAKKTHSRILVQGHLEVEGDEGNPVVFSAIEDEAGSTCWAGIVVDGGNAWFYGARIRDAHTAVFVKQGWAKLKKSVIIDNKCGIIVQGESCGVKIEESTITGNYFGLITGNNAVVTYPESKIQGNSREDIITGSEGLTLPGSCKVAFDKGTVSNVGNTQAPGTD